LSLARSLAGLNVERRLRPSCETAPSIADGMEDDEGSRTATWRKKQGLLLKTQSRDRLQRLGERNMPDRISRTAIKWITNPTSFPDWIIWNIQT